MNSIKTATIFIFLTIFLFGCQKDKTKFDEYRKYTGFWTETKWVYNFNPDGSYFLLSEGHAGGSEEKGSYLLKDSLILLISDSESFDEWKFKRFKIC